MCVCVNAGPGFKGSERTCLDHMMTSVAALVATEPFWLQLSEVSPAEGLTGQVCVGG